MSLNRDRKSWCFICGTEIGPRTICDWKNVDTLKGLLVRFCELLPIPGISFQDWDSLIGVPLSVCCRKCYSLLENVGRLHDLIVETQRQLKEHFDEVEKLVTNSEGQGLQCPYWSSSCIRFREHILANRKIHIDDKEPDLASEVCVKEEADCATGYDDELDNRDWDSEHCNDNREEKYILGDFEPQSDNVNQSVKARQSCIRVRIVTSKESQDEPVKSTRNLINKSKSKVKEKTSAAKKRKIEQEHDSEDSPCAKRRTSPRKAKENAQMALKECSENDSDDGENNDHDYEEDEDDDEEEMKRDKESAKEDGKPVKRSKTKRNPNKFEFHPFLVARENLYLYRFGTFVVRTNTHLQCKAYHCSFQTEFDFDSFPSFQIMRKHIEENHRTRKHINRTPHSCLVCDIPFKLHAEFRNHLRTVHVNQLNNTAGAKAICEICLKPDVPGIKIQSHMMGHKNAEERALARARNEGKQSALRLRESEMPDTERKFACDYENCTYAGKSLSNLRRHKRTHLSKEERPDMVICPECGELIVRESFKTHTERIHHPELVDSLSILHCPICNKRYHPSQRFVLEKHIRSHKGEKPFLCNECGKSFVGLSNLRGHQKEVHGEHSPVKCEWCDKVFNKYRSMRVHARRHHPEKVGPSISKRKKSKFYYIDAQNKSSPNFIGPRQQFPCPICDTLCKYRVTLKVHMRRFHNPDGQSRERKRQSRKSETISGGDDSSSSVLPTQLPSSSSFLHYGGGPSFANSLTNFPNESNVQDLAARKHY